MSERLPPLTPLFPHPSRPKGYRGNYSSSSSSSEEEEQEREINNGQPWRPSNFQRNSTRAVNFGASTDKKMEEGKCAETARISPAQRTKETLPPLPFRATLLGYCGDSDKVAIKFDHPQAIEEFRKMEGNLMKHMNRGCGLIRIPLNPKDIQPGAVALVMDETTRRWIRVELLKVAEAQRLATFKGLDDWKKGNAEYKDLFRIPPDFLATPTLVQKCVLKGLGFWGGAIPEMAVRLTGELKERVRVIYWEDGKAGGQPPTIDLAVSPSPTARMSNGIPAWGPGTLLSSLFHSLISTHNPFPSTPRRGSRLANAYLTTVDEEGYAVVGLHTVLNSKLQFIGEAPPFIMDRREYNPTVGEPGEVSDLEYGYHFLGERRFLARFGDDRSLYRVDLEEGWMAESSIRGIYIDFGNKALIPVEDIIPTHYVDPLLHLVPPQNFRAKLNGIEAIGNVDDFFVLANRQIEQRITIAGFESSKMCLVDVDIDLGGSKGWTYLNQYAVDKGVAVGKEDGKKIIRYEAPKEKKKMLIEMDGMDRDGDTARLYWSLSIGGRLLSTSTKEEDEEGPLLSITITPTQPLPTMD